MCKHVLEMEAIVRDNIEKQIKTPIMSVGYCGMHYKFKVFFEGRNRPRTISMRGRSDVCPICGETIKPRQKNKK